MLQVFDHRGNKLGHLQYYQKFKQIFLFCFGFFVIPFVHIQGTLLYSTAACCNFGEQLGFEAIRRKGSCFRGAAYKGCQLSNSLRINCHRAVDESVGRMAIEVDRAQELKELATSAKEGKGEKPLFSFGVITDIQYADIQDGKSFLGVPRYYRHALECLQEAVDAWNMRGGLAFAIHFGDIVDGLCPKDQSREAFNRVLSLFGNYTGGHVYHMLGNHCLYNLPRTELNEILAIPATDDGVAYYSFSPAPGFLFVVLDGYDVSAVGWPEDHPRTRAALELLESKNPNSDKNSPEGLNGVDRRFVKFNGGVGEEQLEWIEKELQKATASEQKVVICSHLPLDPGAAFPSTLLWNYEEVMDVVHKHNCVVACLAGHAHEGGHCRDSHGVHHHVLEAVLECPPGTNAYGHIDVYPDHLALCGTDRMVSKDMYF